MVDFMDGCYFLNSFEYFPEIYILKCDLINIIF